MNQKLRITSKLLFEKSQDFYSCINHFLNLKNRIRRAGLMVFFILFSLNGFAQLALETFEGGIPSSWNKATGGTAEWTISNDGYLGSNAAFIDPSTDNIGAGNTARYYLFTKLITVPQNGKLRFFTKQSSTVDYGNIYEVRLSTASQTDPNGYTTLLTSWTETELNPATPLGYVEKVVTIPSNIAPNIQVYIAFVLVNNQVGTTPNADTWFIDNVSLLESAICDPVTAENFQASGFTPGSANLSWSHPTASQFEIQVLPQGDPVGTTGIATGNSYLASGLDAGEEYDVYIKTLCSSSDSSGWAGPFNFTTPIVGTSCTFPIVIPNTGAPYIFSSNLDQFSNPEVVYTNPGTSCLPASVTGNYLEGDKAFFSYTATQDGLITITQIAGPTGWNYITGVFVYDGCSNVGVACLGGLHTSNAGEAKVIPNLFVEAGHTYIIVVSSALPAGATIDFTLKVETAPCAPPAVITHKNLLQNSVVVSWNNVGNFASAWEYAIQPAGAGVPTGAGISTATNIDNLINTGLAAGTSYDLYVRSVCGGVPGAWSAPYKFTTQCTVFNTPYTESFDNASASNPTLCWTPLDVNGDGNKWKFSWENIMLSTGNAITNNNDMMVSPMINLGTTPKRLRFKYQTSSGVSRYSVVISTTGIGTGNFTTVILPTQSVDTHYEVFEKIVNIPTSITGNVNIAFYVDPGTDETSNSIILDDIVVEDKPACPDPVALTNGTITTATAQLAWEAGDVEGQWQIVVQPKDTGIPTGTGTLISSNTYLAENLTHATQYEYYVRAYCSSTQQSSWVGPYLFTTLCSVFTVPFYESFNDDDVNTHKSCWSFNDANEDGAAWHMNATEPSIQGGFWGTPSFDDWIVSPAVIVNGTKALKFKYKAVYSPFFANPRFGMEVLMSTTDTNPESFSVVMPLINFTNVEYLEKTVYINANGPVYIAFRVPPTFDTSEGTSALQIDDVRIIDAPVCPPPAELTASNITKNTAKLAWSKASLETQWEVKVQPDGTGIPTTAGTLTSNNTAYSAESLLPNTKYEYYVRAYCSTTEQSEWVGPFVFTTLCNVFTAPFIETFNIDSVSEACWRVLNGNSDTFAWNLNMTIDTYEGNQAVGMFTGSNGNNNDWLISPTITVTAGQRLRYYYRVNQSDFHEDLDVRLSTNGIDITEFTTLLYTADFYDESPLNNTEWKEKVINIPAGITGNINIAWHIPKKAPHWEGYRGQMLLIDKVIIEDIPACPTPSNLVVQNITDTTALASWDANGTETQWDVYVQPAELNAPVGNGDAQYLHLASTNPYTIEGLTAASKYEYYVRAVCDGTNKSEWIGPLEFITMCSFENLCQYTVTLSTTQGMSVGGGIDVIQNGVKLQTLTFPSGAWNEVPDPANFTIMLCTGVEFSLFWDAVGTAPGQYPGSLVEVKDDQGVVLWTGDLGVITPRSTIYKAVSTCGVIACPQPTNLAVNGTSVLSWTAGGTETQWEVAIQPVANNTLPQSGTIVTTNSYSPQASDFINLQAGTYEFFVRAICGAGDTSFWSGPHRFVRNDDASKAITVPVSSGEVCEQSITMVSFMGATASAEPMTCNGINAGDVWFEFVAASKVHLVELSNFSAKNIYEGGNSADVKEPKITMTLYKVVGTGLQQVVCTSNNVILAAYSSELEVGVTYKVRLTLNDIVSNQCTFDICVKTPLELCKLDIPNGGFENPHAGLGGLGNFYSQNIVPGWRNNLLPSDAPSLYETLYISSGLGLDGFTPYEGGQMIQLMNPDSDLPLPDPNDLINIKGMFQDLDSSEITKYQYSFAHLSRGQGIAVQLYAGPPTGPFVLLEEHVGFMTWNFYEGTYNVPAGQNVTRFIFRAKDSAIGNMLDAVSVVAVTKIITEAHTLNCNVNSTELKAEGVGTWVAAENNPAAAIITDPNSTTTTVTNFTKSGDYTFYWKTRYCEYSVVVTKEAVDEIPQVISPVTYCKNSISVPLTASAFDGLSLVWYTEPVGGTALNTAPIPSTTITGTVSYYVAYVNALGCEGIRAEIEVVVNESRAAVTEFSYKKSYCVGEENPLPTLVGNFDNVGTFAAVQGLAINPLTGEINLANSTAGSYEITYIVQPDAATCNEGGSHKFTVLIVDGLDAIVSQECKGQQTWLLVSSKDNTFDINEMNYVWKNENGITVGSNSPEFNVAEYYANNVNNELPLLFTVTISSESCSNEVVYTVTNILCEVPRGISPNGDGLNDNFDLSGSGITSLTIFNRYGKKVYSYGKNYTNQWHGQDEGNNELPDGTYFYSITNADGSNATGWVYINRQY